MLVHWNSHFNITNMENEMYSERSMSMHKLMQYPLFLLSHPVGNLSSHRRFIFQQTLIKSWKKPGLHKLRFQVFHPI